jgi:hypothetical protein
MACRFAAGQRPARRRVVRNDFPQQALFSCEWGKKARRKSSAMYKMNLPAAVVVFRNVLWQNLLRIWIPAGFKL